MKSQTKKQKVLDFLLGMGIGFGLTIAATFAMSIPLGIFIAPFAWIYFVFQFISSYTKKGRKFVGYGILFLCATAFITLGGCTLLVFGSLNRWY